MKAAILKEPSILREGIVNILENEFATCEFKTYESKTYSKLLGDVEVIDLLIVDLDTHVDIYNLIDLFKEHNKKVIVWSSSLDNEYLINLFKLKLHGYFFNGMASEELISAVQYVMVGKRYIHHELTSILYNDYVEHVHGKKTKRPVGVMSNREWEVLDLLTKGYNNEAIAEAMFISVKTAKNHVSSILKKLGVQDRTNAVIHALKRRWFTV
ncbi:response regulator transcription factor [Virgibacillus sp. MSP4-1]|uniref:response regulator transcription factor n=1 Tax=Virgibacillus sp. MSP4-1 TaxID=2700081 RepID=UPI0003AA2C9A|nr:response regulator transcription factor [Virgibacillus sp. MSP4-1]QHS23446.1 response regulator transcription factor [Virgibacillus sp. MSP4-1]